MELKGIGKIDFGGKPRTMRRSGPAQKSEKRPVATVGKKVCIELGNGRRLTTAEYVEVWRAVKIAVGAGGAEVGCDLTHPFNCRNRQAPEHALAQFRAGMHDRINIRGGTMPTGRKTTYEWETAAMRVAQFVNGDPRRAYHDVEWRWIPCDLRRALDSRERRRNA